MIVCSAARNLSTSSTIVPIENGISTRECPMWTNKWTNKRMAICCAMLVAGVLAWPVTPAAAQPFAALPQYAPQSEQPGDADELAASLRRQVVPYPATEPA